MYITYMMSGTSLSVFFEGTDPLIVPSSNPMYLEIREKLVRGIREGLYSIVDLASKIKAHTKGKFTLVEQGGTDVVMLYGKPMPKTLSDMVIKFVEEKQPTDALEAFWRNLARNPSDESRESLYGFIQANGFTLTNDGCFIGYRSVTKDFKDHRTRSMDNSVGANVWMKREDVDPNPENTCSRGLHIAAWDFAWNSFGGSYDVCIEVKVNPKNVVTVPPDYDNKKMRVCEFDVIGVATRERDSILHPETFAETVSNEVTADDDVNANTELDNTEIDCDSDTTYILTVCQNGGVNIPKALAMCLGLGEGDESYSYHDTVMNRVFIGNSDSAVFKEFDNEGSDMVKASRQVDKHNSIRLGSSLFANWGVQVGDQVEARVDADGDIEISLH